MKKLNKWINQLEENLTIIKESLSYKEQKLRNKKKI